MLIKQLEDLPLIPSLRQHCLLAGGAPPNCCFGAGRVEGIGKGQRKLTGITLQLGVHLSWVGTVVFESYDDSK